jgi:hypothetical protein
MNVQAFTHFGLRTRLLRPIHRLNCTLGGLLLASVIAGCGSIDPSQAKPDAGIPDPSVLVEGECADVSAGPPFFLQRIGCQADFKALASDPMDATIPGASSAKVVLDLRGEQDALYVQNSCLYKLHQDFVLKHLLTPDLPPVYPPFTNNYYTSDRQFMLGAVTYYEGPQKWALELAPYDNAAAPMIQRLYSAIKDAAYFGPALYFHPTSQPGEKVAKDLPGLGIPVLTTNDLYQGIDYQPLNRAEAKGYLKFVRAAQLNLGTAYLQPTDIVVLDSAPNDITVVMGIITEQFQTPLSHVNVLSGSRGTPNMGLRKAWTHWKLRPLAGKPVRLVVDALGWDIDEVTPEDVDAWWEQVKPKDEVEAPRYDTEERELKNTEDIVEDAKIESEGLKKAIKDQIPKYGGKASHYSILSKTSLAKPTLLRVPPAFAVPIYYYDQFLRENGFDTRIQAWLDDPTFDNDSAIRDREMALLREDMRHAPVNAEFQELLRAKLQERLPGAKVARFRSSTNSEDLEGFTGAGLYASHGGVIANWDSVLLAVRSTWAATWRFRAFEERRYHGIPHLSIGMALLVHHAFTDELANGVALTGNPFDPAGNELAFYVNAQMYGESVVLPDAGVTTDQFLYLYKHQGQPATYLSQSTLVPAGQDHVLSDVQVNQLSQGLQAVQDAFWDAYGTIGSVWYMDVEFKLNIEPGTDTPQIIIKQARPFRGAGAVSSSTAECQ